MATAATVTVSAAVRTGIRGSRDSAIFLALAEFDSLVAVFCYA
jgi:hypothetical protein